MKPHRPIGLLVWLCVTIHGEMLPSPDSRHRAEAIERTSDQKRWSEVLLDGVAVTPHLPGTARLIRWSPDSRYFLFCTLPEFNESQLADGCRLQLADLNRWVRDLKLTVPFRPDLVVPSPNGRRLAVIAGSGRDTSKDKRLVVINLDGGDTRYLTPENETALWPAWSGNSQQIVFTGGASRHLYRIRVDGSRRSRLTSDQRYRDEGAEWGTAGITFFRKDSTGVVSYWIWGRRGLSKLEDGLTAPAEEGGYTDWSQLRQRLPPAQ